MEPQRQKRDIFNLQLYGHAQPKFFFQILGSLLSSMEAIDALNFDSSYYYIIRVIICMNMIFGVFLIRCTGL